MTLEERIEEAKREAAERHAALTPEVRAILDASLKAFYSRLVRSFSGPETRKGYNAAWTCPVEEFKEFRKEFPATHRWAEWEKSLDL